MKAKKTKEWQPPRGIRFVPFKNRPKQPYGVRWRVENKPKTRTFATVAEQIDFAKALAGAAQGGGVAALTLNEGEAREWRAFRARIGESVALDDVAACWARHGQSRPTLTVRAAVEQFLASKTAEGISAAAVAHYRVALARLTASMGNVCAGAVTREEVAAWVESLAMATATRRTHLKRAAGLFSWLKLNRLVSESPCDGIRPPKLIPKEVVTLTVEQCRSIFDKNKHAEPEVLGRLALEAFAGMRFSSAQKTKPDDIFWALRGINLPADQLKTERRQFIDGLPENLWSWLGRSFLPCPWSMTHRQYLTAKSLAMKNAGVDTSDRKAHNCLRHSFATYHVALHKDVSKTAVILCHSTPKTLWAHYKGRATEADGKAWFEIMPKV